MSLEQWILLRTCKLESALVNREIRASYIEDLHLLAAPSTAPSLIAILEQTPSLHLLSILPPEIDGQSTHFDRRCRGNASILSKSLMDLPPFNLLLDLTLRIPEDQWSGFWRALPRIAPSLVKLDVDIFIPVEAPITPEAGNLALPSSVETLIATITPETFEYLVKLIHFNSTLQRVHLRGRQLDRSPLDRQAITTFLSCNLKRLELASDTQATNGVWHNMLRQPGAFKRLERLTVGFPDNWNPWVPPLPNLQTLVYTHMEWPETDGYGYTTSIVHPDEREEFFAVLEESAAEISRAPKLGTLIELGEWFEDIDYTTLTPEQWIRHCVRVRLFRSYHRGNDTLLHMRELEWKKTVCATLSDLPHICLDAGCDEHYWTHATCFNGVGVNSETLIAIYGMLGQDMNWLTPERGLKLPDEWWELLQE